jgi:hypothetical protein
MSMLIGQREALGFVEGHSQDTAPWILDRRALVGWFDVWGGVNHWEDGQI